MIAVLLASVRLYVTVSISGKVILVMIAFYCWCSVRFCATEGVILVMIAFYCWYSVEFCVVVLISVMIALLLYSARFAMIAGITGKVILDGNADREPNYWIWHYGPGMAVSRDYAYVDMNLPRGQVQISLCFQRQM